MDSLDYPTNLNLNLIEIQICIPRSLRYWKIDFIPIPSYNNHRSSLIYNELLKCRRRNFDLNVVLHYNYHYICHQKTLIFYYHKIFL